MVYPADEETFDARNTPEWIRQGHLNAIQQFLKRIQDFLGYGGRLHDETGLVMPVGAILAYSGITAPSGWLLCDGAPYSSISGLYQKLFEVIEYKYGRPWSTEIYFNVPDLRAKFLRGWSKVNIVQFSFANVDIANDRIHVSSEDFNVFGFPVRFTTDDALPAPFVINTTYYVIHDTFNVLQFATSRDNAHAEIFINITTVGAGNSYINPYIEEDKDSRSKWTKGGSVGENLGSYQEDKYKSHTHNQQYGWKTLGAGDRWYDPDFLIGPGKVAPNTMAKGGVETRPRNVNVNYIIKR